MIPTNDKRSRARDQIVRVSQLSREYKKKVCRLWFCDKRWRTSSSRRLLRGGLSSRNKTRAKGAMQLKIWLQVSRQQS